MAACSMCLIPQPTRWLMARSCNQYGKGAYPQARAVMLTECGSDATVGLHLGDYDEAEIHGAYALLPKLQRGMLLMHDANFFGGAYLEALNAKGVRALFALSSTVALERVRNLPDGSYLARLKPQPRALYPMQRAVWVRVIEYQITDERVARTWPGVSARHHLAQPTDGTGQRVTQALSR